MKKFLTRSTVLPAVVLLLVAPLASAVGLTTSAGASARPSPTISTISSTPTTITITWTAATGGETVVGYTVTALAHKKIVRSSSTSPSARTVTLHGLRLGT